MPVVSPRTTVNSEAYDRGFDFPSNVTVASTVYGTFVPTGGAGVIFTLPMWASSPYEASTGSAPASLLVSSAAPDASPAAQASKKPFDVSAISSALGGPVFTFDDSDALRVPPPSPPTVSPSMLYAP